jgi:hypothetical protein
MKCYNKINYYRRKAKLSWTESIKHHAMKIYGRNERIILDEGE